MNKLTILLTHIIHWESNVDLYIYRKPNQGNYPLKPSLYLRAVFEDADLNLIIFSYTSSKVIPAHFYIKNYISHLLDQ